MIGTGSMSDPYMHIEEELGLTRRCLEIILQYDFGLAIQTKSDRILRDIDILDEINRSAKCVVQMTLTTYDDDLCKKLEPNVCNTKRRIEVLEEMQEHYRKNGKPEGLRLGANIRFINEQTMDFVKRSDLWEVGLNNEAFTKEDVEMFESMGIKVFSNLGDYPEWWQQICDMGIAGFKTNYPDAYTEWWLSTC